MHPGRDTAMRGERGVRTADLSRNTRARRAPAAFEHALLELLGTSDYADITATDVIARSGFSRGSFYRYYTDLDDLLERTVAGEVERYAHLVARAVEQGTEDAREFDRVLRVAQDLLVHVDAHRLFYRALFSAEVACIDFEGFCERAIACFRSLGRVVMVTDGAPGDEEFYYWCTTRTFLVYIGYWVKTGFAVPREQLARQIAAMSSGDADEVRPRFVAADGAGPGC